MTADREIEAAPATLQERLRWYAENPVHQAHSGDYVPLDANWYDIGDKMTLHTLRWDLKTAADQLDTLAAALRAAEEREAKMRAAVANLISLKILTQIRPLVAGWNGENRPGGPHEPHPNGLKVTLTTNAGQVYALDKAIEAARAARVTEQPE